MEVESLQTKTLSIKDYQYLLKQSDFLTCLDFCGVDNWIGYDEAVQMYKTNYEHRTPTNNT